MATPGYFEAAGIPLLEGRPFQGSISAEATEVIVDRALADRLFPGERAVGRTLEMYSWDRGGWIWKPAQIRGVVGQVMLRGARLEALPLIYQAFGARPASSMGVVVRGAGNPSDRVAMVREAALAVDPGVVPYGIRTMREAAAQVVATDRALAVVSTGFSLIALLLVAA